MAGKGTESIPKDACSMFARGTPTMKRATPLCQRNMSKVRVFYILDMNRPIPSLVNPVGC